jgi:hypothetical protein
LRGRHGGLCIRLGDCGLRRFRGPLLGQHLLLGREQLHPLGLADEALLDQDVRQVAGIASPLQPRGMGELLHRDHLEVDRDPSQESDARSFRHPFAYRRKQNSAQGVKRRGIELQLDSHPFDRCSWLYQWRKSTSQTSRTSSPRATNMRSW